MDKQDESALPARVVDQGQGDLQVAGQPTTIMDVIAQVANNPNADVEKLEKLLAMKERLEAAESKKEFKAAKAAWSLVAPDIYKTNSVGYDHKDGRGRTEYKHADLGKEVKILRKSLAEFGFSFDWSTVQKDGRIFVTCELSHTGGHSQTETVEGPEDPSGKKNPIQAIGSGVRYLRRYALEGVTGIAPMDEEDDDGGGNGDPPDALTPKKEWRDEYARMIENHSPGLDADDFSKWCKFHNRIRPSQTWKDLAEARAKKMINDWPDFVARVHEWKEAEPE